MADEFFFYQLDVKVTMASSQPSADLGNTPTPEANANYGGHIAGCCIGIVLIPIVLVVLTILLYTRPWMPRKKSFGEPCSQNSDCALNLCYLQKCANPFANFPGYKPPSTGSPP